MFNNVAQMCCSKLHQSQKLNVEIGGMNFYLFPQLKICHFESSIFYKTYSFCGHLLCQSRIEIGRKIIGN